LTTPKFFLSPAEMDRERITLSGGDHHHLSRVLRARPGDEVLLLDGSGLVARASIEEMRRDATTVVVSSRECVEEETPRMRLYQALLRGSKMDLVIQAAVELGASSVIPYACRRSLAAPDDLERRLKRWRSVALQASRVAGRAYLLEVKSPIEWKAMVHSTSRADLALYADEEGGKKASQVLSGTRALEIALIVGPEGGFEEEERAELRSSGARPVTLGPYVLRAESAGAALLAAARCGCGLL
jgi:16S rRNA (uracil1498-N3)-methyltransferase